MPPPPPQTPDHPEESGQPLQNRPGQKAGDFIERDLWNFDADWSADDEESEAAGNEDASPSQESTADAPAVEDADQPAEDEVTKLGHIEQAAAAASTDDATAPLTEPETQTPPAAKPDLQPDLDEGGESGEGRDAGQAQPEARFSSRQKDDSDWELDSADDDQVPESPAPESPEPESPEPGDKNAVLDDEFHDSKPEPQSAPKPKLPRLSITELISLGVVLVLILGGLGWFLRTFFTEIPTRQSSVQIPDFPVRGEIISIETATSFWREPVRTGPNPDTARREAQLIPVIDLKIRETQGDGKLRVFFRDESGEPVGDPATRAFGNGTFALTGADQLQLAATAGFDDEGKHAAYQTAETEPWTVEVFEGPQNAASFKDFRLLFKMSISAERR